MRTVWKYELDFFGTVSNKAATRVNIVVPRGAEFLTVDTQDEQIMAWFAVDSEVTELDEWQFHIVGTGHRIDADAYEYLRTVFTSGKAFVWHIYRGYVTTIG